MLARACSLGISGLDAFEVTIEVDITKGLPAMSIVGLPDNAIRESKERVRSAIKNSGFDFPSSRITVNLAPADVKKEGPSFDLAIALAILAANQQLPIETLSQYAILGELSLSGKIKPVSGVLPASLHAIHLPNKIDGLIVPACNAAEAKLAEALSVFPFRTLNEAVAFLNSPAQYQPFRSQGKGFLPRGEACDMADVKGQNYPKRGLEVAAAGGHNILLMGPPGSGKTMLARRFPSILPMMSDSESLETTKIHSLAGKYQNHGLMTERPFRSPHHTASHIALVGGGSDPKPGEVTLAHNGVLFMDELPEFTRGALEALRQPMEDGYVTIARAAKTLRFPARFILLATMNSCPCGQLGQSQNPCQCTPRQIQKYHSKISGPLWDRIDIHLEVKPVNYNELTSRAVTDTSLTIQQRVNQAVDIQKRRSGNAELFYNSNLSHRQIHSFCQLGKTETALLNEAMIKLGLSARAYDKILKLARTIADLAGSTPIGSEHLAEAIQYRSMDKQSNCL